MARKGFPSDKQDQYMVRFSDGLRDRIKIAAGVNNRSMNAEIVATLEEKYPAPEPSLNYSGPLAPLFIAHVLMRSGKITEDEAIERLPETLRPLFSSYVNALEDSLAGLPDDERQELEASFNIAAKDMKPDDIQLSLATVKRKSKGGS